MTSAEERSAGVIPFKDGKYFLVKGRKSQAWGFPKGKLEGDETTLQAAHRELLEEAGMRASLVEGFEEEFAYVKHSGKRKRATYYLGEVTFQGAATHEHELDGTRWCDYDEARRLITHEDLRVVLEKARARLMRG